MPHATCVTKIVYWIIITVVIAVVMWATNGSPWSRQVLNLALGAEGLIWLAGSGAILFND